MAAQAKPRRHNILFKLRPLLRWVLKLRGSQKAIAGGLGLGFFLAFTPAIGIQIILALVLATALNLNRAAAVLPVWITNPVTVPPIFSFTYWVGAKICGGPPVAEVYGTFFTIAKNMTRLGLLDMQGQLAEVLHLGREVFVPLVVGSLLTGIVAGVAAYFCSLWLLRFFFARRRRRHLLQGRAPEKEQEQEKPAGE